MKTIHRIDHILMQQSELYHKIVQLWQEDVVFTWRWWIGVGISLFTWGCWLKFHRRESRYRILSAGFFVMVVSLLLDSIGVQLGLWSYRFEVLPFVLAYLPYNLSLMPVVVMGLIQFKPSFSPLVKSIIFGLLTSYVGEPFFYWIKVYNPSNWRYLYSLPIYVLIYLVADWLTKREGYEKIL